MPQERLRGPSKRRIFCDGCHQSFSDVSAQFFLLHVNGSHVRFVPTAPNGAPAGLGWPTKRRAADEEVGVRSPRSYLVCVKEADVFAQCLHCLH